MLNNFSKTLQGLETSPYPKEPAIGEAELIARINWLIRLRWIAVVGVLFIIWLTHNVLDLNLPILSLTLIAIFLALYNFCFWFYARYFMFKKTSAVLVKIAGRMVDFQIFLDLLSLTLLLHFSGGVENPFIFYFIFHMIIASILLSARASYFQATIATILFVLLVTLEYNDIIPHYCLTRYIGADLHKNKLYIMGISGVFITTIYLSVFMATSISKKLREKERLLHEANNDLKDQDRLKSEYVLRVAHDLKSDLATVQSCLKVVIEGMVGKVNEKQFDMIQRAERRTFNLIHFVKDLLNLSRIKARRDVQITSFSLQELISEAIETTHIRPDSKNITLQINIPPSLPMVNADKTNLEHLFINLIINAVKYTPQKGRVQIEAEEEGNQILVKISDTGIGIPASDIPKIFDEFYRAENAQSVEKDGTGLGLAIVKYIVQIHGGKIWVESEEGKGSCFSFTLPKAPAGMNKRLFIRDQPEHTPPVRDSSNASREGY
ncbi:MAG: HAMP domain-containing sensor histidine kinase [Planctomycetota bacterium]|nr:HAMP domain-containing sensor histidine kinase [Planctomycetota bacterium]MDI6787305.1 HAMP domain-containing sensor histidine kinase [Planctomycetota bacterium]